MTERSDHLIERAAARLRGEALPPVPEPEGLPSADKTADRAQDSRARSGLISLPVAFTPFTLSAAPPAPVNLDDCNDVRPALRPVVTADAAHRFQPFEVPAGPPVPERLGASGGGADAALHETDSTPSGATKPALTQPPPSLRLNSPANPTQPAPTLLSDRPARADGPVTPSSPAIVPLDALERAGMVVARTTRTRISEEYRIAIGRILRTLHETSDAQGCRNVIMVTSARPGEGKSFSSLNLAGSIAQNGTDAVLLVDVDPKMKPVSDQLGLGDARGFLDLVSDPALRPEDLVRVTAIPNLAILPVGTRLGGTAQTTGGAASMRPIVPAITRLARRFPKHLIMLDAPPCLSTSDPHTLAPNVGQIVLVVEAERTQRSEVEAALDLVRVCPNITLLLNKVRMTTSHTFGAYDYFGSYT